MVKKGESLAKLLVIKGLYTILLKIERNQSDNIFTLSQIANLKNAIKNFLNQRACSIASCREISFNPNPNFIFENIRKRENA